MGVHRKKPHDAGLFDDTEDAPLLDPTWKQEWKGLPEFVQDEARSFHSLVVHFRNPEDISLFGELVGQKLGYKPMAIWFPEAEIARVGDKRWISTAPEPGTEGGESFEESIEREDNERRKAALAAAPPEVPLVEGDVGYRPPGPSEFGMSPSGDMYVRPPEDDGETLGLPF